MIREKGRYCITLHIKRTNVTCSPCLLEHYPQPYGQRELQRLVVPLHGRSAAVGDVPRQFRTEIQLQVGRKVVAYAHAGVYRPLPARQVEGVAAAVNHGVFDFVFALGLAVERYV